MPFLLRTFVQPQNRNLFIEHLREKQLAPMRGSRLFLLEVMDNHPIVYHWMCEGLLYMVDELQHIGKTCLTYAAFVGTCNAIGQRDKREIAIHSSNGPLDSDMLMRNLRSNTNNNRDSCFCSKKLDMKFHPTQEAYKKHVDTLKPHIK